MSNLSLIQHTLALAAHQRGLGSPEAAFAADQLERLAQLIRFTGASTADQYFERIFANEQEVQEAAYERGYQEGRQSVVSQSHVCLN
jgi:hypothetical protein